MPFSVYSKYQLQVIGIIVDHIFEIPNTYSVFKKKLNTFFIKRELTPYLRAGKNI